MKKIYLFIWALSLPVMLMAQTVTTETFETEPVGAVSFTSNGQVFNITSQVGLFSIYNKGDGLGWNGTAADNGFIDNTNNTNNFQPAKFTISTSGGVAFTLKSMWLFFTNSDLLVGTGTITVTGVRSGATVYTATASLNSPNRAVDNGYALFDMSSYGGADNSNKEIDAFVISATGDFEYIAMDAMTWATGSTTAPVDLKSFSGYLQNSTAHLQWKTGIEDKFDHFEVQKSTADNHYSTIESITPKGDNSSYVYNVLQAEPTANYRLKLLDRGGHAVYSRQVTLSGNGIGGSIPAIYPNPAHDYINIGALKSGSLYIYDAAGRLVKTVEVSAGINSVDIGTLSSGNYFVKVGLQHLSFVKK